MVEIIEFAIIEKIYCLIDTGKDIDIVFDEWGIAEALYAHMIGLDEED